MATAKEVEQQLIDWANREYNLTASGFEGVWENYLRDSLSWSKVEINLPSGVIKFVEEFGGEGQGDTVWVVFSLTNEAGFVQYFQVIGSYASWDGEYWYGAKPIEVEPELVTVTRYKRKPIQ